jgi:hypothetical protein
MTRITKIKIKIKISG